MPNDPTHEAAMVERTNRGFAIVRGTDRYGEPYSIQDSSLATEPCIWLGSDGIERGRAHLTQGNAATLIPLLQAFVEGGSIGHRLAAIQSSPPPAEWAMVSRLRDQEADSVTIVCDNPDGSPNNAVECNGSWTGFADRRFEGETITEALTIAVVAKDAADRDGHPDIVDGSYKPFSTYPEDRTKLLDLARKCQQSDDDDAVKLGDLVRAILEDEAVGLDSTLETQL